MNLLGATSSGNNSREEFSTNRFLQITDCAGSGTRRDFENAQLNNNFNDGIVFAGDRDIMNYPAANPTWTVLKKKLRERYRHLTDTDFAEIENREEEWLLDVQRRIGGTPFELAHLVAEVTEKPFTCLNLTPLGERERLCA
jgi:hypothetical protein